MLDASGRIPQAITQGNRRDPGLYDQCVNIHEKLNIGDIKGKYCYAGLALPLAIFNSTTTSFTIDSIMNEVGQGVVDDFFNNLFLERTNTMLERRITRETDSSSVDVLLISLCIPSACSPSDLFDALGFDDICQTKDQNKILDSGDITAL